MGIFDIEDDAHITDENRDFHSKIIRTCGYLGSLLTATLLALPKCRNKKITEAKFVAPSLDAMVEPNCQVAQKKYYSGKYAIFPDFVQLKAIMDCIAWLLNSSEKRQYCALHGLTQIGKALLLSCLRNIVPGLHTAICGKPAIGVVLTPSDLCLGTSMSYEDLYHRHAFENCRMVIKRNGQARERMYGDSCDGLNSILRREKECVAKFIDKLDDFNGNHLYLFIDELQEGTGYDSVLHRLILTLNKKGFTYTIIGCTATPSEVIGLGWKIIPIHVPDNYLCSTQMYINNEFKTISGKTPALLPIHSIEKECHDLKVAYRTDNPGKVADFFIGFMNEKFAKDKPKSLFLRYDRQIAVCEAVLNALRSKTHLFKHGELEVVKHFGVSDVVGKRKGETDMKSYLIDRHNEGKFCIVMATNSRSHRGESFPKQTEYFFSLSSNPDKEVGGCASMDSELQKDAGRPCGRDKESKLYLWENHKQSIERIRNSGNGTDPLRHHGIRSENTFIRRIRDHRLTAFCHFSSILGRNS